MLVGGESAAENHGWSVRVLDFDNGWWRTAWYSTPRL